MNTIGFTEASKRQELRQRISEQTGNALEPILEVCELDAKFEATLKIACDIMDMMENQANAPLIRTESFTKAMGQKLNERLNKLYIKYFEPI